VMMYVDEIMAGEHVDYSRSCRFFAVGRCQSVAFTRGQHRSQCRFESCDRFCSVFTVCRSCVGVDDRLQ